MVTPTKPRMLKGAPPPAFDQPPPAPTDDGGGSVEDFVTSTGDEANAQLDAADPAAAAPGRSLADRAAFMRKSQDAARPEMFTFHEGTEHETSVLVRGLTLAERDQARVWATEQNVDGSERTNGFVLECAYVHFGMVEPHFEIEELAAMGEGMLDPIYYEILRRTQMRSKANALGANASAPLAPMSAFGRFLPIDTIGQGKS